MFHGTSLVHADWTLRVKAISVHGAHMHVTTAAFRSSDFNGGAYWHVLTSFPFLTILQTSKAVVGKCRTYITVVCRGDEKCTAVLIVFLAAAAAALHGRISNHVLVASIGLFPS